MIKTSHIVGNASNMAGYGLASLFYDYVPTTKQRHTHLTTKPGGYFSSVPCCDRLHRAAIGFADLPLLLLPAGYHILANPRTDEFLLCSDTVVCQKLLSDLKYLVHWFNKAEVQKLWRNALKNGLQKWLLPA